MPAVIKSVGSTPTLLTPAKGANLRQWVLITLRLSQAADVFIGIDDPAVTTTTGNPLKRGNAIYIENDTLAKPAANAIYAIAASGTVDVLLDEGN